MVEMQILHHEKQNKGRYSEEKTNVSDEMSMFLDAMVRYFTEHW